MQTVRTNLSNNASTQYTNFNYNSLCRFNGVTIGAGAAGLFKACCGPDDSGTPIAAYFTPVMTNLGIDAKKSLRYVYLGYQAAGEVALHVTGDEKVTAGPYIFRTNPAEGQQRRRVSIGRGMTWAYGALKISNIAGCDFSIDSIQVQAQKGR